LVEFFSYLSVSIYNYLKRSTLNSTGTQPLLYLLLEEGRIVYSQQFYLSNLLVCCAFTDSYLSCLGSLERLDIASPLSRGNYSFGIISGFFLCVFGFVSLRLPFLSPFGAFFSFGPLAKPLTFLAMGVHTSGVTGFRGEFPPFRDCRKSLWETLKGPLKGALLVSSRMVCFPWGPPIRNTQWGCSCGVGKNWGAI